MTKIIVSAVGDAFQMEVITGRDGPPVFHIHHHYHRQKGPTRSEEAIIREVKVMSQFLDRLRATTARNTDVVSSGVGVLKTLSEQLRTALENDDTEGAVAMLDQMDANNENLARSIAESTPAAQQPSEPIQDDPNTPWDESKGETDPGAGQAESQ